MLLFWCLSLSTILKFLHFLTNVVVLIFAFTNHF
jgi:hypothetical protein